MRTTLEKWAKTDFVCDVMAEHQVADDSHEQIEARSNCKRGVADPVKVLGLLHVTCERRYDCVASELGMQENQPNVQIHAGVPWSGVRAKPLTPLIISPNAIGSSFQDGPTLVGMGWRKLPG